MSDALYNEILKNGLGLNSPSITLASSTITTLNDANTAVDTLPIAIPPADGVTQELVDSTHATINKSILSVTNSQDQMQDGLDNLFSSINSSSSANRIDDVSGCSNLTNSTGSLTGEADEFFNGIADTAQSQIDAISKYLLGEITTQEITDLLTSLNESYQAFEDGLTDLFSKEAELAKEMANKITSSSMATTVDLLWKDPCAQALLDVTLSDEIKDILNG